MSGEIKSVIVVDSELPVGVVANTVAYLGVTLGQRMEDCLRPDVVDSAGQTHAGMAQVVLPILQAPREALTQIQRRAAAEDVLVIGFSNAAQSSGLYEEYAAKIATMPLEELFFLGLAIHGPKKAINKLTGSLPLLR